MKFADEPVYAQNEGKEKEGDRKRKRDKALGLVEFLYILLSV